MIIPIRCFSCSKVLADKWEYYVKECAKLNEEYVEGAEETSKLKNMDGKTVGKILDDLGLTRMCCRRHMIANKDLMDLI
jgi:DNA-directed RNA polymerase subunit N (RpoN/RPB10)